MIKCPKCGGEVFRPGRGCSKGSCDANRKRHPAVLRQEDEALAIQNDLTFQDLFGLLDLLADVTTLGSDLGGRAEAFLALVRHEAETCDGACGYCEEAKEIVR